MKVTEFDFELPAELIAQEPAPRGASRLLVLDRNTGAIQHAFIRDLPRYLVAGDLLVTNDTKVFPARLLGHRVLSDGEPQAQDPRSRRQGGAVECLLLGKQMNGDPRPDVAPHEAASSPEPPRAQIWSALV